MEKLKKVFANFGGEILLTVFVIIIFGCLPVSFLIFEFPDESIINVSYLDLMIGHNFSMVDLKPDFVVIFILSSAGISLILCWIYKVLAIFCKKNKFDILNIINSLLLIISIICLCVSSLIIGNYLYISEASISVEFNDLGFIIYLICLGGMLLVTSRNFFAKVKFQTREMVEISMLIALAIILDKFVSIDIGATGGSFNFSGIPLLLIAIRYGFTKSLISSSVVFSVITCLLDGYGLQTLPFDYMIGFSGYALAALAYSIVKKLLKNKFKTQTRNDIACICIASVFGGIGVFITRMIGSSISSMIYYDYSLVDALIYNVIYVGPSAGICVAACLILSSPLALINRLYPVKIAKVEEIQEVKN